ncbi:MAG: hypothetical protein R2850_06415 [Bacteroidia bacterium]
MYPSAGVVNELLVLITTILPAPSPFVQLIEAETSVIPEAETPLAWVEGCAKHR